MGLVAQGGVDQTLTFTGWRLKDSGSGNQMNFLSGFTYMIGDFQIAPNFLWQRPLEGPIPNTAPAPGRPRNILTDPFVVRANREQVAGEILFTYDPTPGTYMYDWDSDRADGPCGPGRCRPDPYLYRMEIKRQRKRKPDEFPHRFYLYDWKLPDCP